MSNYQLAITHLDGPMKGQSQILTDERIRFGRADSAQVRFPPEFTAIGGEHCQIHRDSGKYEIHHSTAYRVLVNGTPPTDGMELPAVFILELGPRSEVRIQCRQERSGSLPPTDGQSGPEDEVEILRGVHARSGRIAAMLAAGLMAVALAIWLWPRPSDISPEALSSIIDAAKAKSQTPPFESIAPDLAKSVFLVILKSSSGVTPMATAWVVDGSRLATNAHVAADFPGTSVEGTRMYVRSPTNPPIDYEVERVDIHPAYTAFEAIWGNLSANATY